VGGEGEVPDHATGPALTHRWDLARDRTLHANERAIETDLVRVFNDRRHIAARRDGGNHPFRARRANGINGALGNDATVWQECAIEIHHQQPNWQGWLRCHVVLPASANFGHAVATRKIATNRHAPTDTESVGESGNVITLAIAKFQERCAAWAKQARQLRDESANQFQAITATVERKAWLGSDAESRQIARR
jgi:hypothetical protein